MKPLVSIIIPVYNGADYLAEAIESALAQTYENLEILVINDGSKDDGETENVALSFGDKIRYIAKENGGVSSALNLGIKEMKGEYFSWLSHDDLYDPEKVSKQIALIESEKDIVICSGALMDADKNPIYHNQHLIDKKLDGAGLMREYMHGFRLNGLAFLVPKKVFEKVGTFDEGLRYVQDIDVWLRMTWHDYRFICHSDKLVYSRVHATQQTNKIRHLFDKERVFLAEKHACGLKNLSAPRNIPLLKWYLYFFSKESIKSAASVIKNELKAEKELTLKIRFTCFVYKLKGAVKGMLRKLRDFVYKFLKIR